MDETFRLNPCLISRGKQTTNSLNVTDVSNMSFFTPSGLHLSDECRSVSRSPVRSVFRSVFGKVGRWFVNNVLYSPNGLEWCCSFSLRSFYRSRFNRSVFSDTCWGGHGQQKEIAWNLRSKNNLPLTFYTGKLCPRSKFVLENSWNL